MATDTRAAASDQTDAALLSAVLPGEASAWLSQRPTAGGDYRRDIATFGKSWQQASALLGALPKKPARNAAQAQAASLIQRTDREACDVFLKAHAETLLRKSADDRAALDHPLASHCAKPSTACARTSKGACGRYRRPVILRGSPAIAHFRRLAVGPMRL